MNKTIDFKAVRKQAGASKAADSWVGGATDAPVTKTAKPNVPMKRFTIDVPVDLHGRVKVACATKGKKMADVLRELLEREFPKT